MKALKAFFYKFISKKITYYLKPVKPYCKWYGSDNEPVEFFDIYLKPKDQEEFNKSIK